VFKNVYRMLKHFVEEDLANKYDEAYLCKKIGSFLDACFINKIQDPKLAKLVRLVVIFLLKLKTFH